MKTTMQRAIRLVGTALAATALAGPALAQKGETIRIAYIDPLSGAFGNIGQNGLRSWQFLAEHFSGTRTAAGVKFEITAFDNKGLPQESINVLKSAIDQGFRYVVQGDGSGAGLAILDAVSKHNERNPGKELIYLNYAAVDPAMTNEKCDYWHFRFDADTTMKMEALTSFMKEQTKIGKVYLINQNYSHGQQVARYFKEGFLRKRPDAKIVGEDMHPIGQVKDFAPYVAKIKQSGADAIVTGNWGQDLTLLVKALHDVGLKVPMYTYYASSTDAPTALAAVGETEVYLINYGHSNHTGELGQLSAEFKKKFNDDLYAYAIYNALEMLGAAIGNAKSTDPVKVARVMEGLTVKGFSGDVTMRAADHQLQQPMFIAKWQKVDGKYPYSVENTGYTFAPVKQMESYVASTATSCQMKRPAAN